MIWFFGRFNCEDLHLLSAISTEWPRGWQNFHIANHCASFRHKNPARKAAPCRSWEVSQGAPGEGMGLEALRNSIRPSGFTSQKSKRMVNVRRQASRRSFTGRPGHWPIRSLGHIRSVKHLLTESAPRWVHHR